MSTMRDSPARDLRIVSSGGASRARSHRPAADKLFEQAFADAPIGIALVSIAPGSQGRPLMVNRALCKLFGYSESELLKLDPTLLSHPDDLAIGLAETAQLLRGEIESYRVDKRFVRRDEKVIWARLHVTLVRDRSRVPTHVLTHLEDVTAERTADQTLRDSARRYRQLAERDALTGLYNRRRFERALCTHLKRATQQGQSCAVMLVDIDHFKFVNDSLGHTAGDVVLRAVASALQRGARRGDLVARLAGDEFAVLLPGSIEAEAHAIAQRVVETIAAEIIDPQITISAGVAAITGTKAIDADDLLVAADSALYDAKAAGRNRVALFSGNKAGGFTWVHRIRTALSEQRFTLFAQPIIDLQTGEVTAHELLVRMFDERGQTLAPAAFLPTAERFDLILDIDRFVISGALGLAARGQRVNVNLSGRSAGDRKMRDWIAKSVAESGITPGMLTFEITETAAIPSLTEGAALVDLLVALGCGVALDDFGTGFGSFVYIKHLAVSQLKIDVEFVRTMPSSPVDQRIVSSIVSVAQARGIQTIAEGVEDAATLDLLRASGVDGAQGFHIARPMPAELLLD
jgi:diguanylate cyclase (GGDEF)-like protein/PAS domain S-box-containing protein